MRVVEFSALEELTPYADAWDRLAAGVPFRGWTWASCWWRHYGRPPGQVSLNQLCVLAVFDAQDSLVGLAPWYWEKTRTQGRTLRWLGSGEVCSDCLGVLAQPALEHRVAEALADHLASGGELDWDLLEIRGVDADDQPTAMLINQLAGRQCLVHAGRGPSCWRLALPDTWDAYLAMLSKSHRKQIRRCERNTFQRGRAVLHTVATPGQLPAAMSLLVDLHQRRRRGLGQSGCFNSPAFAAFHREVMPLLLAGGQLQLHWLELDGRPVAAEYHLAGGGIVYAYQAGVEPAVLDQEPGRLITAATLRRAIERGDRAVDFLRGDEPYKAHFRAAPRHCLRMRIVAPHAAARLRHGLWLAGYGVNQWMRETLCLSGKY